MLDFGLGVKFYTGGGIEGGKLVGLIYKRLVVTEVLHDVRAVKP